MSKRLLLALLPIAGCSDSPAPPPKVVTAASASAGIVRVVPLKYAGAAELAKVIEDLLEASRRAAEARGARVSPLPAPDHEIEHKRIETTVVPDERTNSLVIEVDPEHPDDMARILDIIARLDVDVR